MVPGKYNVARARGTEEVGGLPGTGSGIKRQLVPVFIRRKFVYRYGTAKIMVPEFLSVQSGTGASARLVGTGRY